MGYNGVGILSVRGSGTSGYVQSNRFILRRKKQSENLFIENVNDSLDQILPNIHILNHKIKRDIEMVVLKLQIDLKLQSIDIENIESKIFMRLKDQKKVSKLTLNFDSVSYVRSKNTHSLSELK